jgi:hypothetical protein
MSTKTYNKELTNLAKLYTNEAKYNNKNNNFDFKLIIFIDLYIMNIIRPQEP